MCSEIKPSETPSQAETIQITYNKNELTGSYKTKTLTERYFQTDYKT